MTGSTACSGVNGSRCILYSSPFRLITVVVGTVTGKEKALEAWFFVYGHVPIKGIRTKAQRLRLVVSAHTVTSTVYGRKLKDASRL